MRFAIEPPGSSVPAGKMSPDGIFTVDVNQVHAYVARIQATGGRHLCAPVVHVTCLNAVIDNRRNFRVHDLSAHG